MIEILNPFLCHSRLDDDKWHSILVERNRKEAMVVVDGARKGQVKEPRGPVRPMLLNNELYIGKLTLEITPSHCIYLQRCYLKFNRNN